jgi:Rps23 Pro-64 3,4-dihydroxylase Tpa1-like proline 4-hydroxylase
MKLSEYLNEKHFSDLEGLNKRYVDNSPFPHIVLKDFIKNDLIDDVLTEFPDLSTIDSKIEFENQREIKLASKGFSDISQAAAKLITFLNSDIFLNYLTSLTGIKETLISDPYLAGGGYHEIKRGGVLKVHADFNKHPNINLDRRLNLLLYLNKDWEDDWGGCLELYDEDNLNLPIVSVKPDFNTCVIFSTTSFTYHGHPDKLSCPENRSRKSLALYYFSSGRPQSEVAGNHSTLFVNTKGEKIRTIGSLRSFIIDITPPILLRKAKNIRRKFSK